MYKVIIWDVLSTCALNVEDPQGNANGAFLKINYKMYGEVTDSFITVLSQTVEKRGTTVCIPPPPPQKETNKRKGLKKHHET